MNKFNMPAQLNGEQLLAELRHAGIAIADDAFPEIDGAGDFWLPVSSQDVAQTQVIVAAHIGIDTSNNRNVAKAALLQRLGITADEIDLLLT